MSIVTKAVWNINSLTDEQKTALQAGLDPYISTNKTDGVKNIIAESDSTYAVERNWADLTSANEWVSFVTTFSPVSISIK